MRPGFFRSVAPSNSFVMLAPRSCFPPNTRDTFNSPCSLTHCLFVVCWSISQHSKRPQGIPRLHRICPPGQVVLHLRHRKLPAPCARGRRHGSRSVGWRLRSPPTRPRARPRVLHPTTGRHHGSRTPQTPPPATPTQGTPRQPEQLHRPVRPPPHARGLRIAETWAGVSVGAAGFYSSC